MYLHEVWPKAREWQTIKKARLVSVLLFGVDDYFLCVGSTLKVPKKTSSLSLRVSFHHLWFSDSLPSLCCPNRGHITLGWYAFDCPYSECFFLVERRKVNHLSKWSNWAYTRVHVYVWCVWSFGVRRATWVYLAHFYSITKPTPTPSLSLGNRNTFWHICDLKKKQAETRFVTLLLGL